MKYLIALPVILIIGILWIPTALIFSIIGTTLHMIDGRGIFTRTEIRTLDERTWTKIRYTLTVWEFIQMFFFVLYMSEHLEELLCGYIPERHEIIEVNCGYVETNYYIH